MSTEGLLGSPPGRRKVPRETEWTDFVSKDTAESTKANTYYFCEVSEDCCFARGAPFAFPRKRSSFSGGRAAWISHVLKCVGADELAAQGITKLDAISPCAGQLTLDTPVVKCALRYLNEQRASEAKKQLKLDAARSGGKQGDAQARPRTRRLPRTRRRVRWRPRHCRRRSVNASQTLASQLRQRLFGICATMTCRHDTSSPTRCPARP
jgi:hypothetical protein